MLEPGTRVIHRSDKKDRKMVVIQQVRKEYPPTNYHNERANTGRVIDGSYYCTWISGKNKGEGYFHECELEILE